eukprot:TRINITY_DN27136_c0_g1_i1.p1 TRINITY_DN27136_c0_g1~~TRINITY_DN27136_c0_g1_i1.p1  ORF type:complete len:885 (+),score=164.62 TRINITY_DN27136_c0_g1_i1:133-2787(+)
MGRVDFVEGLTDDVLSRTVLHCAAADALPIAATCHALRDVVDVTARRSFATIFGSTIIPEKLDASRQKLLARLDRARCKDSDSVHDTFVWAASFGFVRFLRETAAWSGDRTVLLNKCVNGGGETPLSGATRWRQGKAVAVLLELRADADAPGKGQLTPLYWAGRHAETSIAQRLLEHNASPTRVCGRRGDCPLAVVLHGSGNSGNVGAVSAGVGRCVVTPARVETLRMMAENLDEAQRKSVPAAKALLAACETGEPLYLEVMLAHRVGSVAFSAATAAGAAAGLAAGDASSASTMARGGGGNSLARLAVAAASVGGRGGVTDFGDMDTNLAVAGGSITLAPAAAAPRPRTSRPTSAQLHVAVGGGRGGSGVSAGTAANGAVHGGAGLGGVAAIGSGDGWQETTPLLVASAKGFYEILEMLLERDPASLADINAALPSGKTALHLAAERGDGRTCARLLEARASLDALTCSGRSALFAAVEVSSVEAVEAICEHAEVLHLKRQTPHGVSPIALAERRGNTAVIVPMLRCYERNLRRIQTARRACGASDANNIVTDQSLNLLCLKFRDSILQREIDGPPPLTSRRPLGHPPLKKRPQPSEVTSTTEGDVGTISKSSGGCNATRSARPTTPHRLHSVIDPTKRRPDGSVDQRGCLRSQQGCRPPSADADEGGGGRVGGVGRRARPSSAAATDAQSASRRPWGSSARSKRPSSASAHRSLAVGGIVARSPSCELLHAHSKARPFSAKSPPTNSGSTPTLPPLPVSGRTAAIVAPLAAAAASMATVVAARAASAAAVGADDEMERFLSGYFSDDSDEEERGDGGFLAVEAVTPLPPLLLKPPPEPSPHHCGRSGGYGGAGASASVVTPTQSDPASAGTAIASMYSDDEL